MANQVIVTNTGNVQVALTPPPNVQVQISRAAIGTVSNVPTANFANYAANVTASNQPNITSLGTLGNLSVSGTVTTGNVNTPTVYSQGLAVQGYDFVQMQYSNGATLPVSPYDLGTGSWFYLDSGGATFQSNTTGAFKQIILGNDGNINADGNITAPYYFGNGSQLTGITVAAGTSIINGTSNVSIPVANSNVQVYANNQHWAYNTDGSTIYPTLAVQRGDNPSGTITGQTLLFGDNTQEAIISTPDGNSTYVNSQRLVINPGQGYGSGEGGDIYLWAGRGGNTDGNGGDIKIRGGQGVGNGPGGYLRIEAGDTQGTGQAGYVQIVGGQGGNSTGGAINVTGGYGAIGGGDVTLAGGSSAEQGGNFYIQGGVSGNGVPKYGNVQVSSGASSWKFDNGGNLTLPANTFAINYANGTQVPLGGAVANANYANFAGTAFSVSGSNVSGQVANANYATYSGTAGTANSVAGANVSGTVANATYATNAGTAYSVSGANVSGEVANANFASYANIAASANSVAVANVSGIGNIATINLDGNVSNLLTGNGTFVAIPTVSANANYANFAGQVVDATQSNITQVGTLANLNVSGTTSTPNIANVSFIKAPAVANAGINLQPYTGGNVLINGQFGGANLEVQGQIISIGGGNASDGGGQLYLNGSGNNRIDFNTNGVNAPTTTTRSAGTKITLYPALTSTQTDYAMGIDSATMWSSVPDNSSSFKFKWYGNTTEVANLDGTGNLSVAGNITAANINGNVANANYANFAGTAYSVSGANVSGTVANANYSVYSGTASTANSVAGANVSGQVANALVAGTVYTNAQPNITSLGNITSLTINNGNVVLPTNQWDPVGIVVGTTSNVNLSANSNFVSVDYGNGQGGSNLALGKSNSFVKARGNSASPTTSVNNDRIYRQNHLAYNGTANTLATAIYTTVSNVNANANAVMSGGTFVINTGNPLGDWGNANALSSTNTLSYDQYGRMILTQGVAPTGATGAIMQLLQYGGVTGNAAAGAASIAFSRARGNRDGQLSVQPSDFTGAIGFTAYNGSAFFSTRFPQIRARISNTYVANTTAIPQDLTFDVCDNTATFTHQFFGNGNVTFNTGKTVTAGFYYGDGSNLSNVSIGNVITSGQLNLNVTSAGNPSLTMTAVPGSSTASFNITQGSFAITNTDLGGGASPFAFNIFGNTAYQEPMNYVRSRGTSGSPANCVAGDTVLNQRWQVYANSTPSNDLFNVGVIYNGFTSGTGPYGTYNFVAAGDTANSNINFTSGNTNFTSNVNASNVSINASGFMKLSTYTAAALTAITGQIGWMAAVSDSGGGGNPNGMIAFWDTTHSRWSYIHDNSAV